MTDDPAPRRYESVRRARQAAETRADIARAARNLFVTRGWAETTVRDVARAAGVSVPTVYAAYGNKTGLAQALADATMLTADAGRLLAELEAAPDPAGQLAAMAGYDRRLFESAGDIIGLVREAGRTEPDLHRTYRDGRRRADDVRRQIFSAWPADALRAGVDIDTAVDVYAVLCNIDVYRTCTQERGWPSERVERWWAATLRRELLR